MGDLFKKNMEYCTDYKTVYCSKREKIYEVKNKSHLNHPDLSTKESVLSALNYLTKVRSDEFFWSKNKSGDKKICYRKRDNIAKKVYIEDFGGVNE